MGGTGELGLYGYLGTYVQSRPGCRQGHVPAYLPAPISLQTRSTKVLPARLYLRTNEVVYIRAKTDHKL